MLPSSDGPEADRSKLLRRWGPLAALAVVAVIVLAVLVVGGGSDDDEEAAGDDTPASEAEAPTGAVSWSQAEEEGTTDELTWPETCDQETGRVAIPYLLASECYADVEGDNGGETSPGVTADSIKVVAYVSPESDPVIEYVTQAIANDDTVEQVSETVQGYIDIFNATYQTYGRQVDLEILVGTGSANDEVAARADAVTAAEDMGAFAVLGGPTLTSAFADELAAREVVCIGCTGGDPEFFDERSPYLYSTGPNSDQVLIHLVEYMTKKLAGKPAEFAGDEALTDQERSFGYLWIESNDTSAAQAERFEDLLGEEGIELTESVSYTLDPARLQEQATSVITRLKQAGVTTVVFSGDPVAPGPFTTEATAQDFHPEWVLGPQVLVDTVAFSRTYDQEQWAHAFGPSPLTVKPDQAQRSPFVLYEWFHGELPPAADTSAVIVPNPSLFFSAVSAAGPELTPETLQAGLFARPPTPSYESEPSLSFGDHGFWPYPDYNGVDDVTEIWWDPEATGEDEIGREGTGMWRYVNGGQRYLPGEWTEDLTLFDEEGTETILDAPPEGEVPPEYPSP
ncbi:amino acid ABC transporter substrate-binding protein [Iamia sp. SCSIO 61187]|uniref:ABC transporter substrate-binding protein n=1 Tax=Iamia sp. SCSIO 61187 TaxID=2722752 RepID=UPI001C62FAD0|nr:ABC transporter substrate-binding protein [Iamia sp. SCSIO 61187]QYG92744.1 amino acid ABC transporter substrate-binding protein [Iamia sp. SCSIO 61187]